MARRQESLSEDSIEGPAKGATFPGMRVVAGCFLSLMTTAGLAFYGIAVYLNAFSNEKSWSLSSISFATTVFFVVGGVVGLLVARLITRFDARVVMTGGATLGAVALALLGQASSPAQMYLVYVLFACGFGGAGLVPVTTIVTRWFIQRRSVAISIASTGLSVGGMVITPIAKWMTDHWGLSTATPILAVVWLLGTVPFIMLLIKPDPIKLGWLPDGKRIVQGSNPPAPTGAKYADAIRSRFFWLMTIAYVMLMAAQVGGIQQLVKLAEERTGATAAAFATFVVAGMSVVARLVGGRIIHLMPMGRFTVILGVFQGLSLVAVSFTHNAVLFFLLLLVFGATVGNILMLQSLIISHRFGVLDYARLFSRSQLIVVLGTAGGPLLLGWLYDLSGTYQISYLVAGCISIAGAAVMHMAGPVNDHDDDPIKVRKQKSPAS
ncbi:MAG: MFS transporter [Cumulibacter sp.]